MSFWILALLCSSVPTPQESPALAVTLVRTPEDGLQPRAAVDAAGVVHLLYFVGDPAAGELRYARSSDGAKSFSKPLTATTAANRAMATGNVRGGQLALGRDGRAHVAVHVVWNGVPAKGAPEPMSYARLDARGSAFEPPRDLAGRHHGLDGGGAVAADGAGNVSVVWHAPEEGQEGEAARRVWVASSTDDGATFAEEVAASEPGTGVCPCCGLNAFALDGGGLAIVYRCAREEVHRDMLLVSRPDARAPFTTRRLDEWNVPACVMSTVAFARGPRGVATAFETQGKVRFTALDALALREPAACKSAKHPTLAIDATGETLMAWSEGVSWGSTGRLAWQTFGADGRELAGKTDAAEVPAWSLCSAVALPGRGFLVFY